MSENRPLQACLALSVVLHAVILALPGVRVAPDVSWLGRSSAEALFVTIVAREVLAPDVGEKGLLFSRELQVPGVARPLATLPDVASSGLRGELEESPVVERSPDDYLPPSLLDKPPRPKGEVDTQIDFKGMDGLVGDAEIMLLISSDGEVDAALLVTSSLPGFLVDQAVMRFKSLSFEPGELAGFKVRSRLRIRLTPPSRDELLGNPYSAKQRAWHR